jgi:hypothetical protein
MLNPEPMVAEAGAQSHDSEEQSESQSIEQSAEQSEDQRVRKLTIRVLAVCVVFLI